MKQYLVLLKGKYELDYSPIQLRKRQTEFREWVATIKDHYLSDNRLARYGAHIRKRNEVITDGPFLDAKEIIAGFFVLQATDLQQAIDISNTSPLLEYFEFFVRPIID